MTPQDRRARLQDILNRHHDIARALRRSSDDATATQEELLAISRTVRDTATAIREATTAMIAANEAALALYQGTDEDRA